MYKTIDETLEALKSGKATAVSLIDEITAAFNADKASAKPLNAFLELYSDAREKAAEADKALTAAKKAGTTEKLFCDKPLLGVPFANKDNISSRGHKLTCASKILAGYIAPYNATVIERLEGAGAIAVGRCNQDEFAMGSSTEYSVYGPTRNPLNREYVSGGSSGGSAAAVAAGWVPFSLGTETGGSVRLPGSYCGLCALKPTYGTLSRWGVVAYGSSLDQVGVMANNAQDVAKVLSICAGLDERDDTSYTLPDIEKLAALKPFTDWSKLRIAIPKELISKDGKGSEALDRDVGAAFEKVCQWFSKKGATIESVSIPVLDASIASYYVIALSEAASNLSRFDGVRYGARVDKGDGYDELYIDTRSEGFGPEVKRRIIIGNYVLSEQFSGSTYKKAMSVRARIQREFAALFEKYDLVLCPTCPTPSFKLGQKVDNPLEMYLSDMYTTFVNLARIPSVSVNAALSVHHDNMPIGVQFAGAMKSEAFILSVARAFEEENAIKTERS